MPRSSVSSGRLGKVATELKIEGIEDVLANIGELVNRASGEEMKKEVEMPAAFIIVNEAKDLCPYDPNRKSGIHLRDAIFAAYGDPKKPNVVVGVNHRMAPHSHLVEYGHGGKAPARPHPFFRPAVTATRSLVAAALAINFKKFLEKITAKNK